MIASPSEIGAEEIIGNLVLWLKLAVEAIGALVIGIGMLLAASRFIAGFPPAVVTFVDVRLTLARFLAIALEFLLGADILSTAVAQTGMPSASWPQSLSSPPRLDEIPRLNLHALFPAPIEFNKAPAARGSN